MTEDEEKPVLCPHPTLLAGTHGNEGLGLL